MSKQTGRVRIGISGWRYTPWRGVFYPKKLAQRRELEYASRQFPSIELNGSFYALQRPKSYAQWYADTPDDFVFSIKGSRYITHIRRLRDVEEPLASFFASGLFELKEKLGPFLWQFPPSTRFDAELFDQFLSLLPHSTAEAQTLARRHARHMAKDRVSLQIDADRPLRHAVEIRNESFVDPAFIRLLRKHRVALVFADTAGKWPYAEDLTADFVYLRLHGDIELYKSGYGDAAIAHWAKRIDRWRRGEAAAQAKTIDEASGRPRAKRDVYCYFDNDVKVKAPVDAASLMQKLGVEWTPVAKREEAA